MLKRYRRRLLSYTVASLLAAVVALLYLAEPTLHVGAQDDRVLQVWPDRSVGVTSGLLEGATGHAFTEVLSFGVSRTSTGAVVRGRTYLHFPLDVFPPGAEIVRATLHLYVDAGSREGEATFGAYRVLDAWTEKEWERDPDTWPALLTSPIATMVARFDVITPTTPALIPAPIAAPAPAPTATPHATPTPTATSTLTPTPPTSPLSTPTEAEPTASPTPTPPTSPLPTPTPPSSVPVVTLGQVAGTWLTWDVTALMRGWRAGEAPDQGIALAAAPDPDADPETASDLLVARWLTTKDLETMPYLIVEITVHPVTPAPTATPVPVLPPAGGAARWQIVGLLLVGAALLALGLSARRR